MGLLQQMMRLNGQSLLMLENSHSIMIPFVVSTMEVVVKKFSI